MEVGNKCVETVLQPEYSEKLTVKELDSVKDSYPEGVIQFYHDDDLTFICANEGFYRICGYSRSELAGKSGTELLKLLVPWESVRNKINGIKEPARSSGEICLEFGIARKGGAVVRIRLYVTVVSEMGHDIICCMISNLTRESQLIKELQAQQERYRIITEQLDDVFFEYHFINDSLEVTAKWEEIFGFPLREHYGKAAILKGESVYEDDKPKLLKVFERAEQGTRAQNLELRLRRAGGGYIWVNLNVTSICDDEGRPVKAIGKITDIDAQKKEREKLISNAQRDPLTGLYNKAAAESLIRSCLRASDQTIHHALMIIDVDNFKGVNDNLGHLFGDAVLREISAKLRMLFRSTDILGRFGGDEFIVFLKNVGDDRTISAKAEAICDIFRESYTGINKDYKISGSVGVSVFPEHGDNFYELFQHADTALYGAKKHGKDGFVICGAGNGLSIRTRKSTDAFDGLPESRFGYSFVSGVCKILSEAEDKSSALQSALKLIGRKFCADHVFVYSMERKPDQNDLEWYADQKELPASRSYDGFDYERNHFQDTGFYYCPDLCSAAQKNKTLQLLVEAGIRAVLYYPIYESGVLKNVIGVEGMAPWKVDERRTLLEGCRIIGMFLLRYRKNELVRLESKLSRAAIENEKLSYYVVDPETWSLLYINKIVQDTVPGAVIGSPCYQVLKNRSSVCENCPAAKGLDTSGKKEAVLYNESQNQWLHVTASPISWQGGRSILISCSNITDFVK
ncbi:MAG TPA: diguanylate cyclase [Caproiciproducens sp.]|nr:diguanylate cyclase [Caproiciproducens sp.]